MTPPDRLVCRLAAFACASFFFGCCYCSPLIVYVVAAWVKSCQANTAGLCTCCACGKVITQSPSCRVQRRRSARAFGVRRWRKPLFIHAMVCWECLAMVCGSVCACACVAVCLCFCVPLRDANDIVLFIFSHFQGHVMAAVLDAARTSLHGVNTTRTATTHDR